MGQGKSEGTAVKQVAQSAQHALAEAALVDVDHVLEGAIDQDQREKDEAQDE